MVERSAGLSFGFVESLMSGRRVRLVFELGRGRSLFLLL